MSEPVVSFVEIGAVPQMMWQCPKCMLACTTMDPQMISPVGAYQQVEWQCECGHTGRLARARIQQTDGLRRQERRRLAAIAKKQSDR